MIFRIEHRTHYRYSRPVFIEPMSIRLTPASNLRQRLIDFDIDISEAPMGVSPCIDLDGNSMHQAWFTGLHNALSIRARSTVETLCPNPFDFVLLDPGTKMLPAVYSSDLTAALAPYRGNVHQGQALESLVADVRQGAQGRTLDFLLELNAQIYKTVRYMERVEGPPMTPANTLAAGSGSCRDTAMIFMAAARSVGLAARFVSGYHCVTGEGAAPTLHAWAEIYLPGVGWRGYDPSIGLATADRHVALAAAAEPLMTAPTSGRFRGTDAHSELNFRVVIEELQAPSQSMIQSA